MQRVLNLFEHVNRTKATQGLWDAFERFRQTLPEIYQGEVYNFMAVQWFIPLARFLARDIPSMPIAVAPVATSYGYHIPRLTRAEEKAAMDAGKDVPFHLFGNIDVAWAMSDACDLTQPIISATILDKKNGESHHVIIDGAHRLYGAFHRGIETIPVVVLPADLSNACRSDGGTIRRR